MSYDNAPLPDGWIREIDPNTQHPFWVDTRAKPPRSIWVHPYEDEQFLREHPDVRDRLARERPASAPPPPYSPRRHSYAGSPTSSGNAPVRNDAIRPSVSQPGTPGADKNRGFFGKLKDKAIGTKEEREARRLEEQRRQEQYMRQLAEQRRLRQQAFQQQRMSSPYGGYGGGGFGGYGAQYGRPYGQSMYGPPAGSPFGMAGRRPGRSGFGGIGMPLLAGAAGGLLLGEMLDGPDYGGYDGGGGFDGGGFDGGGDF
ncbi:hypothetical protein C8Q76DRAFT_729814 [Earliella scabrosa]|nr:hypothetical protein C8Q76DRAFT_729814 [Earliella scabrosa]